MRMRKGVGETVRREPQSAFFLYIEIVHMSGL